MAVVTMKMTDIGEGVTEAELVEWNAAVGDVVREDDIIATVMTDKAAVEIPALVGGRVIWLAGAPGDMIRVGSVLVRLDTGEAAGAAASPAAAETETLEPVAWPESGSESRPESGKESEPKAETDPAPEPLEEAPAAAHALIDRPSKAAAERPDAAAAPRPLASPAIRSRARDLGVDLGTVKGSGPDGRILHRDLDAILRTNAAGRPALDREIKLAGLRRLTAEKVAISAARIPHFTIVEAVDVSALEDLRRVLNEKHSEARGKLTILPFVVCGVVRAVRVHPGINGHFDDAAEVLRLSEAVHVGIATQTPAGLTVPVIRNADANGLWETAAEIARLSDRARQARATRDELTGSTITVTSLGPLGGLVTTPIINHPEIAIIGVNKIEVRPVWDGRTFNPRRMMNLSCSFDHRVIDGWDAAVFLKTLRELLETPALLFLDGA